MIITPRTSLEDRLAKENNLDISRKNGIVIIQKKSGTTLSQGLDNNALHLEDKLMRKNFRHITRKERVGFNAAGLIGIGKTTFLDILQRYASLEEFLEDGDSLPLKVFYNDMKNYAFPLQLHLGKDREGFLNAIEKCRDSYYLDRSPYEDLIFTWMLHKSGFISDKQLDILMPFFKERIGNRHPDILTWLYGPPELALDRSTDRGRISETGGTQILTEETGVAIQKYFGKLVKDFAPPEIYKPFMEVMGEAGVLKELQGGGLTLDYMKSLDQEYRGGLINALEYFGFNKIVVKVSAKPIEEDQRMSTREQFELIKPIYVGTLISLGRQGFEFEKKNNVIRKVIKPHEREKPYKDNNFEKRIY